MASYAIPTRAVRAPYSRRFTTTSGPVLSLGLAPAVWSGAIAVATVDDLVARLGRVMHATVACPAALAPEVRARTRVRVLAVIEEGAAPPPLSGVADGAVVIPRDPFAAAALVDAVSRRLGRLAVAPGALPAAVADPLAARGELPLAAAARATCADAVAAWRDGAGWSLRAPGLTLVGAAAAPHVEMAAVTGVPVGAWCGAPWTFVAGDGGAARLAMAWAGVRVVPPSLLDEVRAVAASLGAAR